MFIYFWFCTSIFYYYWNAFMVKILFFHRQFYYIHNQKV